MKKFIVISINDNPEYLFYLPLCCWAWRQIGWIPVVMYVGKETPTYLLVNKWAKFPGTIVLNPDAFPDYLTETIAQVSRLYASCNHIPTNDYVMTGDIDMIPLSDYWKFDPDKISVWGHDLTNFQHYPICYIGMKVNRWAEVMKTGGNIYSSILKDLGKHPYSNKTAEKEKRWVVDQDIITERLNGLQKDSYSRGVYDNGYPIGRVDRSAWNFKHERFIDCHLPRNIYEGSKGIAEVATLMASIWPDQRFEWIMKYTNEFNKTLEP